TRRLIPKAGRPFGFDVSLWFTTRQHGFGFTRLMSILPAEFSLTLYFIAHYHGSLPQQHEVVWNLLPTADPGGPSTISL
ncbi:TPA: hypothetical protein ACUKXB_005077, partial [Escherichia coli]